MTTVPDTCSQTFVSSATEGKSWQPVAQLMAPCLRGRLHRAAGSLVWCGQWADTECSIDNGWGAPFKYRKHDSGHSPSGLYSGFFHLDAAQLHTEPEDGIALSVAANGAVSGSGQNRYGKFEFRNGTYSERTGEIRVIKQYTSTTDQEADRQEHERKIKAEFRDILGTSMVPSEGQIRGLEASTSPIVDVASHAQAAELLQRSVPGYRDLLYVDGRANMSTTRKQLEAASTLCWSFSHNAELYHRMVYEGLFAFADTPAQLVYVLLGKCSPRLSVFRLDSKFTCHLSKRVRKLSARYGLSINSAFDEVLERCQSQHGTDTWLTPPFIALLKQVRAGGGAAQLCSVELRELSSGTLVAGELGLIVGTVYTSLTGFHSHGTQSCGTIQILALGSLLRRLNFTMLNFEEPMDYKVDLGAITIDRTTFYTHFTQHRTDTSPILPTKVQCATNLIQALPTNCAKVQIMAQNVAVVSKTQQKKLSKAHHKKQKKIERSGKHGETVVNTHNQKEQSACGKRKRETHQD